MNQGQGAYQNGYQHSNRGSDKREGERGLVERISDIGHRHYDSKIYFWSFLLVRISQFLTMVPMLALAAVWVSEIDRASIKPNPLILESLIFPILGILIASISIVMLFEGTHKGLFAIIIGDVSMLVMFAVLTGYWATPLAYVNCSALSNANANSQATAAQTFAFSLSHNVTPAVTLRQGVDWWASTSMQACEELLAVWGFCIALTALFLMSATLAAALLIKMKKINKVEVGDDDGYTQKLNPRGRR